MTRRSLRSRSRWQIGSIASRREMFHVRLGVEQLEERRLLVAGIWTALGPAPVTNGQTTGSQPVSGRVAGLAADPTDANIIYAAAAGGGVWKTTNGGSNWTVLTDNEQTLSMGAIAVANSNPNIVYAGTGEANFSGDSNYGRGILVSQNGGINWTLTGSSVFDRRAISKISIDPSNASIAYAAVARATGTPTEIGQPGKSNWL